MWSDCVGDARPIPMPARAAPVPWPKHRRLFRLLRLALIFLNRLGMFSSSKGSEPQSRAYRMTPQDQTSTSGPAYSRPEMTCAGGKQTGPWRGSTAGFGACVCVCEGLVGV
jgi:hypothetical protein